MLSALRMVFDSNSREIRGLTKKVEVINRLETEFGRLSDAGLREKTGFLKGRLRDGATLDEILPEAFAVIREASRRVLHLRPFDVQLMGGIVLHQGRIAEMKTGEGKTLVAILPAYLNALTGEGVHIVTVNDYLARRDSEWMGKVFKSLGMTVGLVVHGLGPEERRAAYAADITYGTNNEFGFDYLRDNMALSPEQVVQKPLHFAIVDEVDSILVDEARTPLIISGQADKPTDMYFKVARIIPRLRAETDYEVDEKAKTVALTEKGVAVMEKMLSVSNLYDDVNMEISHHVNQALRAHALMKRDRDYVVKDGQVIIVDEFTGRLMFGRRYSEGLHQAIEAKEDVKIERESQTLATITFQNYFRMYHKLAGMTGTAATEEEEFRKIYGLDVVVVPTNMPMIRQDLPDSVYRTEDGKFRAVVEEVVDAYKRRQPVLVGTISIEKSEKLSSMLQRKGIPHQVLNAKFHEQEARIVAQAGRLGAITIATNMAGRGTDIMLGGNPEFLAMEELRRRGEESGGVDPGEEHRIYEEMKELTDKEHDHVVVLGGLHIIGTERHESRRIDNQLRGRAGRQGDPGSTRFYVSLGDDLMRLFGADAIAGIMDRLGMDDNTPIDHGLVSRAIENAQKKVEARHFDARKHVLEYDDVMNQQREVIYNQRREVLTQETLQPVILTMLSEVVDETIESFSSASPYPEEWDLKGLLDLTEQTFLYPGQVSEEQLRSMEKEEIRQLLHEHALENYRNREAELGENLVRQVERMALLKVVDEKWMDHLDAMDQLRQGIGLRAYGQRDPLIEYKFEAYEAFNDMVAAIRSDVVRHVFRARVVEQREPLKIKENREEEQPRQPVKKERQVGRNDPCPCGSGKKYKKCCGASVVS